MEGAALQQQLELGYSSTSTVIVPGPPAACLIFSQTKNPHSSMGDVLMCGVAPAPGPDAPKAQSSIIPAAPPDHSERRGAHSQAGAHNVTDHYNNIRYH